MMTVAAAASYRGHWVNHIQRVAISYKRERRDEALGAIRQQETKQKNNAIVYTAHTRDDVWCVRYSVSTLRFDTYHGYYI